MTETTIKFKADLPLPTGAHILAELDAALAVTPGAFLVELRLHRGADGEVSLATVTSWLRVDAITARESDLAWARRQRGRRSPDRETINGQPPMELSVYPAGSLRARLVEKRRQERPPAQVMAGVIDRSGIFCEGNHEQ